MSHFVKSIVILVILTSFVYSKLPEEWMSTPDLIRYWGYPVETHYVVTEDGYNLTLHRIPYGKSNTSSLNDEEKPVVFLQHGFLDSSAAWVINLPRQSFGFILADAGYDVWLGNIRGNMYSKRHVSLDVKSWKFWDFCFDDISKYDLPAMINYALKTANQKQLYYVGYSQGSLMAFAGLSENVALQEKISIIFAFAPTTRLANVKTPLKPLVYSSYFFIRKMRDWFRYYEFFPASKVRSYFERFLCYHLPKVCDIALSVLAGFDNKNINETRYPVYLSHLPAGTSVKNMLHFMQLVGAGVFQKYNYFTSGNLKKYGTKRPPQYNITKVTVPTVLIQGMQDWLATPKDVDWTAQQLPHVLKRIQLDDYNHIDFVWGISARKDVYDEFLNIIDDQNRSLS